MTDFVNKVLEGNFEHAPTDYNFLRLVVSELAIRQDNVSHVREIWLKHADNFFQFLMDTQSPEKAFEILRFATQKLGAQERLGFSIRTPNFIKIAEFVDQ